MTSYNAINHSETKLEKQLMKISSCRFGLGGYQDCQFGLFLNFESKGTGVSAFITGGWDYESIKVDKH